MKKAFRQANEVCCRSPAFAPGVASASFIERVEIWPHQTINRSCLSACPRDVRALVPPALVNACSYSIVPHANFLPEEFDMRLRPRESMRLARKTVEFNLGRACVYIYALRYGFGAECVPDYATHFDEKGEGWTAPEPALRMVALAAVGMAADALVCSDQPYKTRFKGKDVYKTPRNRQWLDGKVTEYLDGGGTIRLLPAEMLSSGRKVRRQSPYGIAREPELPTLGARGERKKKGDRVRDLKAYLREAAKYFPRLNNEEELRLVTAWRARGDRNAWDRLVVSNLPWVTANARRGYGILDDFVSEGVIGLIAALKTYDPEKATFATHAQKSIRGAISAYGMHSRSLLAIGKNEKGRIVGMVCKNTNRNAERLFFNLDKEKRTLGILDDLDMTKDDVEEIAKRLKVDRWDVLDMNKSLRGVATFSAASDDAGDETLDAAEFGANLEKREDTPDDDEAHDQGDEPTDDDGNHDTGEDDVTEDDRADKEQQHGTDPRLPALKSALESLDARKRRIVEARFIKGKPATYEALAAEFGVSDTRVRQGERDAKEKMKVAIRSYMGTSVAQTAMTTVFNMSAMPRGLFPARAIERWIVRRLPGWRLIDERREFSDGKRMRGAFETEATRLLQCILIEGWSQQPAKLLRRGDDLALEAVCFWLERVKTIPFVRWPLTADESTALERYFEQELKPRERAKIADEEEKKQRKMGEEFDKRDKLRSRIARRELRSATYSGRHHWSSASETAR
jgi:RNA polymerase sigma factor (sigma-70 family)